MVVALIGVAAACGGDGDAASETSAATLDTAAPTDTVAAPDTAASPGTTPPTDTEAAPDTASPQAEWERIAAPAECMCSDGSEFSYFVRRADPTKVVFFLEGGGACFDAAGCGPGSTTYQRSVGYADGFDVTDGLFDLANPANPVAGFSIVFVPYCTGDVHLGNATHDYGNGVVIEHKGYVNASTALGTLAELFPDATELLVTGASAGSVPTPLYAGLAADLLPEARITVFADGSGAYPDIPAINGVIGSAWGTANAIPPWPENAGLTAETWSFPGLFIQAGKHAPEITFARHDYAFDATQTFFAGLAGIRADDLVSLIDQNEAQVEAGGVTLWSYIAPGDDHTVVGLDALYTEEVDGVRLIDWLTALVDGEPVDDVHCEVCETG